MNFCITKCEGNYYAAIHREQAPEFFIHPDFLTPNFKLKNFSVQTYNKLNIQTIDQNSSTDHFENLMIYIVKQ